MPGDINGFDPFPGPNRWPFADFWPGPANLYQTHPDYKNSTGFTTFAERNFLAVESDHAARYLKN